MTQQAISWPRHHIGPARAAARDQRLDVLAEACASPLLSGAMSYKASGQGGREGGRRRKEGERKERARQCQSSSMSAWLIELAVPPAPCAQCCSAVAVLPLARRYRSRRPRIDCGGRLARPPRFTVHGAVTSTMASLVLYRTPAPAADPSPLSERIMSGPPPSVHWESHQTERPAIFPGRLVQVDDSQSHSVHATMCCGFSACAFAHSVHLLLQTVAGSGRLQTVSRHSPKHGAGD